MAIERTPSTTERFLAWLINQTLKLYCFLFSRAKRHVLPPIEDDKLLLSVTRIVEQVRRGQLKSVDLIKAYFKRIDAVNPHINAVVDRRVEEALQDAEEIDSLVQKALVNSDKDANAKLDQMTLLGVPFSVKDSIHVKGLCNTYGLVSRRNMSASKDATAVMRLKAAGAIPIVMTNIPELLTWYDSANKLFGRTNNPYDLSRIPGGTSGGEGALLASAGSLIGIGTDIGGSLRIPASFCGIYSHKITSELVPMDGIYPQIEPKYKFMFTVGPMCRYVDDIMPIVRDLVGDKLHCLRFLDKIDVHKLKFHYICDIPTPLKTPLKDDVKQTFMDAISRLEKELHVECHQLPTSTFSGSHELWIQTFIKANTMTLRHAMANGKGNINLLLELVKSIFGFSKHTLRSIMVASAIDDQIKRNLDENLLHEKRKELLMKFESIVGPDAVLLCPTHPEVAPRHAETLTRSVDIANATLFNVIGVPVTQCPLGFNTDGLPIGVQIVARSYNDRLTISVARKFDEMFGGWKLT